MSGYRSEIPSEVVEQTQRIQEERHTERACWHCGGSKIDPDGGEDLVECCVCQGKGTVAGQTPSTVLSEIQEIVEEIIREPNKDEYLEPGQMPYRQRLLQVLTVTVDERAYTETVRRMSGQKIPESIEAAVQQIVGEYLAAIWLEGLFEVEEAA